MILLYYLLLIQVTWRPSLSLYHELSMETFTPDTLLPEGAIFGYSITYVPDSKTLIVSAPKADIIGKVYTCNIQKHSCAPISHNLRPDAGNPKHEFWLGATVKAGSNFFVTCAPRHPEYRLKYGTYSVCFYSTSHGLKKLIQLSDSEKEKTNVSERYMDSFGWSIDIDSNNHIVVGSPVAYKGRVIKYEDLTGGISPTLISAKKTSANYNYGYSVALGNFQHRNEIAIGSPYGKNGYGAIYTDRSNDPLIENEDKDLPVGSLFAASLCSANLDGKITSFSYLLVGAPTYANMKDRDDHYNMGAVFIYQKKSKYSQKMVLKSKIIGLKDGGYFGSAMANLGDLNGDNKDEVAISAPYEDDGRGAVYIYSGAQLINSAVKQIGYLQRIQPIDYRAFGLSLTALTDYDGNGCNELAIGAPGNNSAVLLRCMAAINVEVVKLIPNLVLPGKFGFQSCVRINYPPLPKTVNAEILVELEIVNTHVKLDRAKANENKVTYPIKLTSSNKNNSFCNNETISTPSDSNFYPVLQYQITAILQNDPRNLKEFDPTRVLLSDNSILSVADSVWIGDCEKALKCNPVLDLQVKTTLPDKYVIGSSNMERLSFTVGNTGDTAYSAGATILIAGVRASKWPRYCTRSSDEELSCKNTALLRNNSYWNSGDIELETKNLVSDATNPKTMINITVTMNDAFSGVNSTTWNKVIELISSSENVTIKGTTKHGDIVNVTLEEASTTGAHIDHVYSVINNGKTPWGNAKVKITLQKEVFLPDGIVIYDNIKYYTCSPIAGTKTKSEASCLIFLIEKENKLDIVVPIELLPGELETIIKKGNAAVVSTLEFELNGDKKTHTVTSKLFLYEVVVPIWIFITAALLGLFLLLLLAFAMYECGFLRRKNKQKLKELKRDVKRQTIRRSTMIQHGPNGGQDDRKQLINAAEDEVHECNADVPAPQTEIRQKPEILPKPKLENSQKPCDDNEQKTDDNAHNGEASKDKVKVNKDPRMELLMEGLQEKLRNQPS